MGNRRFEAMPRAVLSREEARAMDRDAMERLGIPGPVLMENAARGLLDALRDGFPDRLERVLVVGGPGNNGGDGWALCRHLRLLGLRPRGLLLGDPERLRGDAALNWSIAERLGVQLEAVPVEQGPERLAALLAEASLLVDAVFGTGLQRPVQGAHAEVLRGLEQAAAPLVAVDVPSGACADTGRVLGFAPRCAMTVTFGALKRGLLQYPARGLAGELRVASIGAPLPEAPGALRVEAASCREALPARPDDVHKGHAGHVLVVAGSPGKGGAAVLAARGALRAGAGLVTVASRAPWAEDGVPELVEAMSVALPEDGEEAAVEVLALAARARAVVFGPGLGLDAVARRLVRKVALRCPVPTVLDADALTLIAEEGPELLRSAAAERWLTPHPGEAARLLGGTVGEVQADRYAAARRLAERTGQLVVLKGAGTVVAAPDTSDPLRVCDRGSPAMATAGSGDVLAGVCGALLAAGGTGPAAAAVAVFLHAVAGEYAAKGCRAGLLAHELADYLPPVINDLQIDT